MRDLMMDDALLVTNIMRHAELNHPRQEIVSVTVDNPLHRYTFADAFSRTRRLAKALDALGASGDARIATLAWNDHRHYELYYAIACSGRVCHTINPRLFSEQLVYIINHAEDEYVFVDLGFVPLLEQIADQCPAVRGYVVMTDEAHMPQSSLPNLMCYETLIADVADDYQWPALDERTACGLCYTSGTTGNPKGVLYGHRSTVVHTYAQCMPDVMNVSSIDATLAIVPMFHVNAWGTPFSCTMVGAKMVFPGAKVSDPATLVDLIEGEQVTMAAGVPTVWLPVLKYARETGRSLKPLNRTAIGGSACPLSMMEEFRDRHGVQVLHAWGMTEMSPLGTVNAPKPSTRDLTGEAWGKQMQSAGRPVAGVELKIVDDDNKELPRDGEAVGLLKVRGPWVCADYFKLDGSGGGHDEDGWFATGDVVAIDPEGYIRITDRTKDVIKSGGEWISSIDLENVAIGHAEVSEAAVIGVSHPKWQERPLLVVVRNEGSTISREELLDYFEGRVAKWWIPDDVAFVDELPHTATGKLSKLQLRQRFSDYQFPDVAA